MLVARPRPTRVLVAAIGLTVALSCGESVTGPEDRISLAKGVSGPTVTSTAPLGAPQDTTLEVHVFGTGFDRGSSVAFLRDGVVEPKVHVNRTTYRTSGELVANVTIAADAATVTYDVAVVTSGGKKGIGTELFVVMTPLETLESPTGSWVNSVSPTGLIVGWTRTSCGPGSAPALWNQARQLTSLAGLSGTCGGVARAINGSGVAVGSLYTGSTPSASVRWIPSGGGWTPIQLPNLPSGQKPGPWDIDESGTISSGNDAAVWSETTGWQLLPRPAGTTSCAFTVLNGAGQLTGACMVSGRAEGVFWSSPGAAPVLLPMPPRATGAYVRGINATGVIAGFVTATDVAYRAVRWTSNGGSWTATVLPDLGKGGSALQLNDAGYIVGSAYATNGFPRPSYWDLNGTLHVLDSADRSGEATGVSEPENGLIIAGYYDASKTGKTAVRWRP